MKNISRNILIILIFVIIIFFYFFNEARDNSPKTKITENSEKNYSSNIIKGVFYESIDTKGNRYIIKAETGEIDIENSNIIFLTKVNGLIDMVDSEDVKITSLYGKYNINNYDTIFSKNVIINYLDNKILSQYLDFSFGRNSMIISKNVVYTNLENKLKADVVEINIKTKDTKIFMYENQKKVNIKSIN